MFSRPRNLNGASALALMQSANVELDSIEAETNAIFSVEHNQDGTHGAITATSITSLLSYLGTIISGVWNGTIIGLLYGGTGANLSATGGTNHVVKQASVGAVFTTGTLASTQLSDTANIAYKDAANVFTVGPQTMVSDASAFPLKLRGRASDNQSLLAFYSNDGATLYGYMAAASTSGGQFQLTSNGTGGVFTVVTYFGFSAASGSGTGVVKVAGTALRGTTEGTNHIDVYNGTAPAGTLANGFSIYSSGGKCFVMDSGGLIVKLQSAGTYTETNVTADRAYDANATTIDELADVVGTLIADLRGIGLLT